MLERPSEQEYDPAFARYISLVPEGNFFDLLGVQTHETRDFFEKLSEETGNYRYAPDKWSIKEILGHVMDSERVFAYRALCFARGEQQPLPGFDQEAYARVAEYDPIPLSKLVQQYTALRVSTFLLLEQLPEQAWKRTGISNQKSISVRALAYIIAGHERHHMRVITERYGQRAIPLVN
jgi:uncharacterized damage-inducible protein DinB